MYARFLRTMVGTGSAAFLNVLFPEYTFIDVFKFQSLWECALTQVFLQRFYPSTRYTTRSGVFSFQVPLNYPTCFFLYDTLLGGLFHLAILPGVLFMRVLSSLVYLSLSLAEIFRKRKQCFYDGYVRM